VPAEEQMARVGAVVAFAAKEGACVTVDTASPVVAAACLDAGACAVNDVSCLRDDTLAAVCASHDAVLILMHAREPMSDMKGFGAYPDSAYGDVVRDVVAEWTFAADRAAAQGLPKKSLVMDPGLGFAKNAKQSARLLAKTRTIQRAVGVPVAMGASRKSFLTLVDPPANPAERLGASIAAALFAVREGASIVRVHDVRATRQAIEFENVLANIAPVTRGGARGRGGGG
jgi:dihydropteroate synthase